ncbi:hypothetical protein B0I37DRAFT_443286 [Chaetomium sp. MPI-CAGE-AT-0009]|nr:hypothetical protein B0I37DRAFT_443286 [Chaetomium sp. MPI-CAGE-AT-0009]
MPPPHLHPRSRMTSSLFATTVLASFLVVALPHILPCPAPRRAYADGGDMAMQQQQENTGVVRRVRRRAVLAVLHFLATTVSYSTNRLLAMKALSFLLTAGLASARIHLPRQAGINNLNNLNVSSSGASNVSVNGASSFNLADFNLGDLGLDGLEVGGLNLGSVDLGNQDVIADAILAMLGGFCLGNTLDRNNILSFGFNNDVDLFFQLAQLMQLEQLGFLDLGGVQSLFNNGQVLGGFNLGVFKREVSEAKKMMKRTKLRRGQKAKRQCATGSVGAVGTAGAGNSGAAVDDDTFNIATAPPDTFATATATAGEAGFTIATVPEEEAGFTIATAVAAADTSSTATSVPSAAVSTSVAASATQVAATPVETASEIAAAASDAPSVATTAAQIAASAIPAVAASAAPVAAVDSVASVPAAAAAGTPVAAADAPTVVDDVNLADLTR